MVYVESLGIYVNKVEDLRDKVSEDLYQAIEHLSTVEVESYEEDYWNLKEEFEAYEGMLDSYNSAFNEIINLVDKFDKELNNLYDYVSDSKRISREKVLSSLKDIEVDLIEKIIYNYR